MFASTATVPKNALTTAQLSKDELVQLYQLTRSTWLTPIAALSQAEQLELAYVTLAQFPLGCNHQRIYLLATTSL